MKKLTYDEFNDRVLALQRARKIFIETGLTSSITKAFEAYQSILSDQERLLTLSSQLQGSRHQTMMDRYERPLCPECKSEMRFRSIPDNPDGIKTQLVCSNSECDVVLNDTHDLIWWMGNLRQKDV